MGTHFNAQAISTEEGIQRTKVRGEQRAPNRRTAIWQENKLEKSSCKLSTGIVCSTTFITDIALTLLFYQCHIPFFTIMHKFQFHVWFQVWMDELKSSLFSKTCHYLKCLSIPLRICIKSLPGITSQIITEHSFLSVEAQIPVSSVTINIWI